MSNLSIPPLAMRQRRSSLFEVGAHRVGPIGSSIMSFGYDPHKHEEDFSMPKQAKVVQYENTYKMDPPTKFVSAKVKGIMDRILEENLTDKTYEPLGCSTLSKTIVQEIKNEVKLLDLKRYKYVCLVTIGEKNDQGVRIGSRCVWDTDRDDFASSTFENRHLFATALVFAFYYE